MSDGVHRLRVEANYEAWFGAVASPAAVSQSAWFVNESGAERPASRTTQQHQVQRDGSEAVTGPRPETTPDGGEAVQPLKTAAIPQGAAAVPGAMTATSEQDAFGRPVAWFDRGGVKRLQLGWGEPGSVAQATLLSLATTSAQALRQVDDWGRVVAIKNPGQGWQTARYDAADRVIEVRDPRGARQVAQWDAAGRLRQLQRSAPNESQPEQTSRWTYAGRWADEETVIDADGARTIRTDRNGRGQVLRQSLLLRPAGALSATLKPIEMSVAYTYDEQGPPAAAQLHRWPGPNRAGSADPECAGAAGDLVHLGLGATLVRWWRTEVRAAGAVAVDAVVAITAIAASQPTLPSLYWATDIEHSDRMTDRYEPLRRGCRAKPTARQPRRGHNAAGRPKRRGRPKQRANASSSTARHERPLRDMDLAGTGR